MVYVKILNSVTTETHNYICLQWIYDILLLYVRKILGTLTNRFLKYLL